MSTVVVKNSETGAMGSAAAKRSRYEKAEMAYGFIPAAAYNVGDTLEFDGIPMKKLIYAKFVATANLNSDTTSLELFAGTDISSPVAWDIVNDTATGDINYFVTYIRGTGKIKDGIAVAGEGQLISLTIASSCN